MTIMMVFAAFRRPFAVSSATQTIMIINQCAACASPLAQNAPRRVGGVPRAKHAVFGLAFASRADAVAGRAVPPRWRRGDPAAPIGPAAGAAGPRAGTETDDPRRCRGVDATRA